MRNVRLFVVIVVALLPSLAAASGPTTTTGTSAASTSSVTVTIPAVIAIDVESNFTFDFTSMPPTGPNDCVQKFPPGANCTSVIYTPTTITHLGGVTAASGHLWISIFSSKADVHTTMTVTAHVPAAFTGGSGPGFTPSEIRLKRGTSNNSLVNGATFGYATETDLAVSPGLDLKTTAMTNSVFGWSRIDQLVDLQLPGNTAFNSGTFTADVTFTLKH